MARGVNQLLLPFKQAKAYWYIMRAFWPYPGRVDGVPGFHRFLKLLIHHQAEEKSWTRDNELEVLIMLEGEGIVTPWEEQDDYHANFRIRVAFAKQLGFATSGIDRPLQLTPIGQYFLDSSPDKWPEIFEHQLIRLQFGNPNLPARYGTFQMFPYTFTLSVLLGLDGNYLTLQEFVLRTMLSKTQDERQQVIDWIQAFRALSDSDKASADAIIELNPRYAARMWLILFAYTPSLEFQADTLSVRDRDRARYLLAKCWPHLAYTDYPDLQSWEAKFGDFDAAFWPLIPPIAKARRQTHQQYVKREESDAHKGIKRHLIENAETVFGKGASLFEEEYLYASGDSANLVFYLPPDKYVAVEVEVDVGEDDITGLLQAIKYKYMFAVQEKIQVDQVKGMLVAKSLHPSVKAWCSQYGIDSMELHPGM